jgi:hypothetical protein
LRTLDYTEVICRVDGQTIVNQPGLRDCHLPN